MNLKRMAVVAAAAVVGPTVLMATPAMADEAPSNPAVSTPDAAPAAEAPAPAAETPAPVVDVPVVPAPVVPAPNLPASPAPAVDAPSPAPSVDASKPAEQPAAQTPAPGSPSPAPAASEKPAAAKDGAKDELGDPEWQATGPKLTIKDMPANFTAGTSWKEFVLHVDNSKGEDLKDYSLGVSLLTRTTKFTEGYISLEVYLPDENGKWGWHPVDASGTEDAFGLDLGRGSIEKGDSFDIKLRLKFAKDAPATEFAIAPVGWSNVEGEEIFSDGDLAFATLQLAGNTGGNNGGNTGGGHTGGTNGGGNTGTKPNGGTNTTPIVDHTTDNGGTTHAGGELAETGTDAATSWALGAGGVALALGAALVAGTGRRRRVQA
ncbi:LPXTG cell wall anchor domain-containing protein [Streptomyces sp. NPDC101733]|uniref:LPXTG cell wall anchor domain-containing protein n=1 Tax=unclassified Streptomyces TaxID=2593676 RepID=UPI00381DCF15